MRAPRSVLVVVTRRIGDVLLATPVVESLAAAWPDTSVDMLVFDGTQGVLRYHPRLRNVRAIPERPAFGQHVSFVLGLLRRYDIALSLVPGDRPTLYAVLAGRWSAGLVVDTPKHRWKRWLLDRWIAFDERETHTVRMHLALLRTLAVPARAEVTLACGPEDARCVEDALPAGSGTRIAVLHVFPKFNYKMWHERGWAELGGWLIERGWTVALTGSAMPAEVEYVSRVANALGGKAVNLAGALSLGGVSALLGRARLYVGPDTAVTHMAAAAGAPTVALFGPTDPVKWGPWPRGHTAECDPWTRLGDQVAGNVAIVQGDAPCVPCNKEGCERHIRSFSNCLLELPVERVIAAINKLVHEP